MNLELFFNILNIVFAVGSNNWISLAASILLFLYNLYSNIRKNNLLSLVIDNQKENKTAGEKVSNIFKIKFVIYTIISIFGLCYAILYFFDDFEYMDFFNIFKVQREDQDIDY